MRDECASLLAAYSAGVNPLDLAPEVVHEVERRILDSFGVALAAIPHPAPQAASAYAVQRVAPRGATLWGNGMVVDPEVAAFCNGVHVRYLDFNDTYLSLEPLHPSDMIPGLLALAEWRGLSARELIAAIATGYEVAINLCDAGSLRAHGWDHVNYTAIGAACGGGRLLGLTPQQIEQAIAITTVAHAAMRQSRAGELSMWKGAAAADATRHALMAVLLAEQGFTGPFEPFVGEMGWFRHMLGGERFLGEALATMARGEAPRRILDTHIKFWPVEYHAQSAVDAALQLRGRLGQAEIKKVNIATFQAAYEIIAKDPEKWRPQTRETADHSLPYIVLAALLDGRVDEETFSPSRITDPVLRDLLAHRTALEAQQELTERYPEGIPNCITVETADGRTERCEVTFPRGHARNPMTDDEVVHKFMRNVQARLSASQAEAVVDHVFRLHEEAQWQALPSLLAS